MAIESGSIVQERELSASAERVFEALHDPERMARWLVPGELESATVDVDFRVGGTFKVVMHGSERDFGQSGEYLVIEPPRRLVFTWVSDFVPEAVARTRVSVSLDPLGPERTRLRLVHDELPREGDDYDGHQGGWSSILDKLEALLRSEGEPR
ncbi:MAG: SRPBCC family protein [Myxococcota bacterium]|nr:SRPBCC family protein [Myxococcota bacterium]